jgi:hypothetical protein
MRPSTSRDVGHERCLAAQDRTLLMADNALVEAEVLLADITAIARVCAYNIIR